MKTKELTKLELELMQILWSKDKAFVNDILEVMPEPKLAYSTVSTMMRILVEKGVVSYNAFGKSHQYYPLITKQEYTSFVMKNVKINFFENSLSNMVSFFAKKEKLSAKERQELIDILNNSDN